MIQLWTAAPDFFRLAACIHTACVPNCTAGVVQNFATANASAGAQGAYLGNPEPTIWKRPAILAIGDSITEMGLDPSGGWTARLADAYARKVGQQRKSKASAALPAASPGACGTAAAACGPS